MTDREQWRAQLVSSSGRGDGALDELVSALGVEGSGAARLVLRLAGQRVQVGLERRGSDEQSPAVTGVVLTVKFERGRARSSDDAPPSIVLRHEGNADDRDKERGLVREVQLGYARFDHAVFIDNDSSEEDVRRILSKEATRQAVLRLLDAGHFAVRISTTGVSVHHQAKDGVIRTGPVLDALEDLLIVARAGGPKDAAPTRRGETLLGVGVGLTTALVAYGWLAYRAWPTTLAVVGVGLVAGLIVAFFSRPSLEAACAGDSNSARRALVLLLLVALSTTGLVFGALEHLNGALDDSSGDLWRGVVEPGLVVHIGLSRRGFVSESNPVNVRWDDGSTSVVNASFMVRPGDRVSELRHPGALGFPWFDERRFESRR